MSSSLSKTPYRKTQADVDDNEQWIQQNLDELLQRKKKNFGESMLMLAAKSDGETFLQNKPIPKSGAFCFICVRSRPNDEVCSKIE